MLRFVLGRAGSGKTETIRRMLADRAVKGLEGGVLLVPEQYSFETEKAMLRLAGPQRAGLIQVYSFTRLAEAVFRREGGAAGRRLSDGGRRILMACAVDACQDQLEVYDRAARSGRVTDVMLTAVNEMKLCGIAPGDLARTAARLGDRGLGKKLRELSLLYETYQAMVEASYLDSRDDLTRLAQALEDSDFFAGCTVGVDSFEGFTAQERKVLVQILRRADQVVVSLCTDGQDRDGTGLFALVDRTRRLLTQAAEENGVAVEPPLWLAGAPRFENENLALLESQLFSPEEPMTSPDHQGIQVFRARDVYEEAEFAAATIRDLVIRGECRYRDVSLICRDPQRYYGVLDVALAKRDIPCFVSQPIRMEAQPVARLALGAFRAAASGCATEDLLVLLKTGLLGFTAQEVSALENYAYLWKITGAGWRQEFVRHPRGFGEEFTQEDREELSRLNGLRRRLVEPLLAFSAGTRDATGEEITDRLYGYFQAVGVEETLPAYCQALEEEGEESLSALQLRVWDLLLELLDQMRAILGEKRVSRERYGRLLREVVEAEDVSEIPQTVDQVIFGTAEQVRQSSPRAAFLIGAVQGEFPLVPKSSGVFSDAERRELIALDLPLGDPLEQKTMEERYLAYSVACAPSQRLYLSWPAQGEGEDKEPSELIAGVLAVFPTLEILHDLPGEYFANSREAAFSRMAACFTQPTAEAASLRQLFQGDPAYQGRMAALERAAGRREARLSDPELPGKLFGERPRLSPSQIESYQNCPFQYFCRYGLGAKERRPAEVDVLQYGTLMHFLFERVFRCPAEERAAWGDQELEERIWELIQEYAQENLGGLELLRGQERYRLERLARSAGKLIRHVEEELSQSRFTPEGFELGVGRQLPPLKVRTQSGALVTVGGTIDRVDVYRSPGGKEYVRVIDYKTGNKVFQLSDVLYGLNMQMLVYLAALVEAGDDLPAGVLYLPAAEPSVSVDRGAGPQAVKKAADRQMRMNGVVLEDTEIIEAMEAGARGIFIPASLNKDGTPSKNSAVLTGRQLETVLAYSKKLIAALGDKLLEGRVEAKPHMKNRNACKFCPYGPVCGQQRDDKDVERDRTSPGEALEQMERAVFGGKGGEDRG